MAGRVTQCGPGGGVWAWGVILLALDLLVSTGAVRGRRKQSHIDGLLDR